MPRRKKELKPKGALDVRSDPADPEKDVYERILDRLGEIESRLNDTNILLRRVLRTITPPGADGNEEER
jgi:hypothetical protein